MIHRRPHASMRGAIIPRDGERRLSVRLICGSHMQTGDVLLAVDGKIVIGMNKMEVASLLMRPDGS